MPDPLIYKSVSYGIVGLLAFTALILSVVSLRKELTTDKPVDGLSPVILIIAGLCVFISLASAYVQLEKPASMMFRWEWAALTPKE
jgi:hypothetical protein